MAQQENRIEYKDFQLFEDRVLGRGSYGRVCKAKYDDLLCAAKIIHHHLCDDNAQLQVGPQREHRHPFQRFESECGFIKAIRHPNIVQFLGIVEHRQLHVPILLTELMDCSLTQFLETAQQTVPYCTQVNFCHDIALALAFLHSNSIIHRDLSSNNVLLIGDVRAKVTDFGMAKFTHANSRVSSMTKVPGADVYMPPEAVEDNPVYTEKIDSFSFGVTVLQILTRKFPEPGNRVQQIEHPDYPKNRIQRCIPEVERRQDHISEVNASHPLLSIVLECIKDNPDDRPTSHALCCNFEVKKDEPRYSECRNSGQPQEPGIPTRPREERSQIGEMQQQLDHLNQQLEQNTQLLIEKNRIIEDLSQDRLLTMEQPKVQRLDSLEHQPVQAPSNEVHESNRINEVDAIATASATAAVGIPRDVELKLQWREARNHTPYRLSRNTCTAAIYGGSVYFNDKETRDVYMYNPAQDSWNQLPYKTPYRYSSLAVVNNTLTTIGGKDPLNDMITNRLMTLVDAKQWEQLLPPMLKRRYKIVAVWSDSLLIIAGGMTCRLFKTDDIASNDVEVLDIDNLQWHKAVPLPERQRDIALMYNSNTMTAAICGNCVYILADDDFFEYYQNEEFSTLHVCTLNTLLKSCEPKFCGKIPEQDLSISGIKWRMLSSCPRSSVTCVAFGDQLFIVGGTTISTSGDYFNTIVHRKAECVIQNHNLIVNCWEEVGYSLYPRFSCFATVLPSNEILVVGGYNTWPIYGDNLTDFSDTIYRTCYNNLTI